LKLRILIPAIYQPRLELKKETSSLAASFTIFRKLHQLTASLLLLVITGLALAPLAAATVAPAKGMHCKRMPLSDARAKPAPSSHDPAMHCHHAAPQSLAANPEGSASSNVPAASFRASDCCCNQQCDCCRNSKTSTWARPAFNHLTVLSLIIESAQPSTDSSCVSAIFFAPDSARAPPQV